MSAGSVLWNMVPTVCSDAQMLSALPHLCLSVPAPAAPLSDVITPDSVCSFVCIHRILALVDSFVSGEQRNTTPAFRRSFLSSSVQQQLASSSSSLWSSSSSSAIGEAVLSRSGVIKAGYSNECVSSFARDAG